ncbi:unnamed protein product [Spirodela intermedia]|uniref:non-specific serine/threonine protein kinase n=1 Tax=Spirodela intermedia TaxID=51605 RepID=A0A7I8I7F9_SPIIN|nr:unnamed protein product [Spirodela intermedia]CAA6653516.1 unnamed protein product [Spirodela intermedia]
MRWRWLTSAIGSAARRLLLLLLLLTPVICCFSDEGGGGTTDGAALLQFKREITSDPAGLLSRWTDSGGEGPCSWPGVSCDGRSRVVGINVSGRGDGDASLGSTGSDPATRLTGRLSTAIGRLTELRVLSLPFHSFRGEVPGEIWELQSLEVVDLEGSSISGVLPGGEIPSSLSGCVELEAMDLSRNRIKGTIPGFFGDLPKLRELDLSFNKLGGRIPGEIGDACPSLEHLDLSGNLLVQSIPTTLGSCKSLRALLLSSNLLEGILPAEFRRLEKLQMLNVSRNRLNGCLPAGLGSCRALRCLDVSKNQIGGRIPQDLGLLGSLVWVDLSWNKLQGQIPVSFGQLKNAEYLLLAGNNLTGEIPAGLLQSFSLKLLDVSSNHLSGEIPKDLFSSKDISVLGLNSNNLSGEIASSRAGKMRSPSVFSSSFNHFSASAAQMNAIQRTADATPRYSFLQSSEASSPASAPAKKFTSIEVAAIVSAAAIVSVLLSLIALYVYTRKCLPRNAVQSSERREVTVFMETQVPLTYENVVRATGYFTGSNCIGSGGFGATYKAEVAPGVILAIKRLSVGRVQGIQHFHAEIKTLGTRRHPNLVTLIGYHLGEAETFLIYNYLPGGNLEKFIRERSKRPVDWWMLHKIALDIARALKYLHHRSNRILHRDVKPSNILLDNELNAYLSDFGLARLLGNSETHLTTDVEGTFGYVAPEYATMCRVSDKADVYSYGVVLLELLSDKKVFDPYFSNYGNGFTIVSWAGMCLQQGREQEFFTEGLWDVGLHDDLVEILNLAVMCTDAVPSSRPTMKVVVQRLKQLAPPTL